MKLEEIMRSVGYSRSDVKKIAMISIISFILSIALLNGTMMFIASFSSLTMPFAVAFAIASYKRARMNRAIDDELPDVLMEMASMSSFLPLETIIESIGKHKTVLGKEFREASNQIKNGMSVEEALSDMGDRCKNRSLSRAIDVVMQSYRVGSHIEKTLREVAEEIRGTAAIIRERKASALIERWTMLLAGGIIVPAVLGIVVSMVSSMDFAGLAELGMGISPSLKKAIIKNAILGNQIYIVEYSIIASVFVAYQEGEVEKALVYASILVPLGIAIFLFFSGLM